MIRGISALTLAFTTFAIAYAVGADPATKSTASKSTAAKSTTAKSTKAKAPTIPDIESDAKKTLASQWLRWNTRPVPWETCLRALELAVQGGAKFPEALDVLATGYDGKSKAKNPYAVPAEDADVFWDWLAGAATNSPDLADDAKLKPALAVAKTVVDCYYRTNNRGLMEKVDANFAANNPRVAIFQLLTYAAKDTLSKMETSVELQKKAEASDALKAQENALSTAASKLQTDIDAIANSITTRTTQDSSDIKSKVDADVVAIKNAAGVNSAAANAADQLARYVQSAIDASSAKALNTLKGAVDQVDKYAADAKQDAKRATDQHSADVANATNAGDDVCKSLKKLESIRLCYASVDKGVDGNNLNYRKKLSDYVAGKFHRSPTGS